MVRKAAKFAVYEDKMMRVKNHHADPTILPERDLYRAQCHMDNKRLANIYM